MRLKKLAIEALKAAHGAGRVWHFRRIIKAAEAPSAD